MEERMQKTEFPRFLLAAAASGSGKTLITCGILQALKNRGLTVSAFKCGPDYIDPMFHERVLHTKSRSLDTFFTDEETTRYLFVKNAAGTDVSVIEGVMGYYDGLGGVSEKAGAYDLACITGTPAVLIVDAKGMSLSALACIKGFLTYRENSHIRGVILNRISPMLYPRLKERIETELSVRVFGHVPPVKDCVIESRHLGLVTPDEIPKLSQKLQRFAEILEDTLDLDGLLALAQEAEAFLGDRKVCPPPREDIRADAADDICVCVREESAKRARLLGNDGGSPKGEKQPEADGKSLKGGAVCMERQKETVRRMMPEKLRTLLESGRAEAVRNASPLLALAKDEAFCFFYEDNLQLLREFGLRIREFSLRCDQKLPEDADGLLLCGGYPELYAKALSQNTQMRTSVRERIAAGLPCLAECGGFMYLHETMEDMDGRAWDMAGVIPAKAFRTERLTRFGYIELQERGKTPEKIRAHEFHYFDSTDNGDAYTARKPLGGQSWNCIHKTERLFAGFPHLFYYSAPEFALRFAEQCAAYQDRKKAP